MSINVSPALEIKEQKDAKVEASDPDFLFAQFLNNFRRYHQNQFDEEDIKLLTRAYEFAKDRHKDQKRTSGEPYIIHPIAVADLLLALNVDLCSLVAALLHDTVEDTNTPLSEITQLFGETVANLVDGLTKIGKIKFRSNQEKLAENFRKMIIAMARDLRVVIIKLCDRLHNMSTLDPLAENKQHRIAAETLEIYAPLANRLGLYGIKSRLEDYCLKFLKPDMYQLIKSKIAAKKAERESNIGEVLDILKTELGKYNFEKFRVYGRPKHFYSIYKKIIDRHLDFEDIHDLFAFRIIVPSVKDCYEALGVVHAMWKPMPGRFKDYIAMPKANLYQSLHTTVIRPNGEPCEIQIRTFEMHQICEFGVAAHWVYKEKKGEKAKSPQNEQQFSWLRQFMEWQNDIKDPNEFLETVKVELFEEEIFVFTPKGDVMQLPANATALDFAFSIHTELGLKTVGAKVNGRLVPIKHPLLNGDIIEIVTSKNQKANKDWLNFVKTSKAKNRIRSHLRSEQREQSKIAGRELLQQALAKKQLDIETITKSGKYELITKAAKESNFEDVLIAIGYGKLTAHDLLTRALPQIFGPTEQELSRISPIVEPETNSDKVTTSQKGFLVSGLSGLLVNVARCCNPLPGENVVGFITRGKGISVHRQDCPRTFALDPSRKIEVSWSHDDDIAGNYAALISIISRDKAGVLANVTTAISAAGANIKKAQVNVSAQSEGHLDFEVSVKSKNHLDEVLKKIRSVPDVVSVIRKGV